MNEICRRLSRLMVIGTGIIMLGLPQLAWSQGKYLPPTVQDCLGAIPVCQPVYTTTNSYVGHGNIYPEIHSNSICPLCMDGEKNDVFYIITVQNTGILRFKLTPNNPTNDYDWSVFNMTNSDCSQLYSNAEALQVSCNSYGATGNNGPTGINTSLGNFKNCNGPGTTNGPAFNRDLLVMAGETYLINISNWSTTAQSGYTLDFSESTATIFDTVPPGIDSVQTQVLCSGSNELYVRFTENMKCLSVQNHPEKFSLNGPGGVIPVTGITCSDCVMGGTQSPYFILTTGDNLSGGNYTLSVIGDITDLCDNVALYESFPFTLTEINAPVPGAGNDTTVNNGAIITLHGTVSGGTGPSGVHWEPAAFLNNPDVLTPVTLNMGATTEFTLTAIDSVGCDNSDKVLVNVVGGPLAVLANASPTTICNGEAVTLNAIPTGGSGNYTYSWSSSPSGFTSNLQNPTVYPTGNTTYAVVINDGFSNNNASVTVTVNTLPVVNAGPDKSVAYGTSVQLFPTVSGGGSYDYVWTSNPSNYYSTQQNPTFTNLTVTTAFTIRATDQGTGCQSLPDEVIVTVTGSPLSINPITSNPVICQGAQAQLYAMAGGGSGTYTYSWTSAPAGFTSSLANPVVTPSQTTTYYLTIDDGFNQSYGSVIVIANPVPVIDLGPADTTICIYNSITLDAGNSGSGYYWSNGATTQTVTAATTGIGYDIQAYTVHVINLYGCVDSASVTVGFSFAACTGIEEPVGDALVRIFPNPNHGQFTVSVSNLKETLAVSIESMTGQVVFRGAIEPGSAKNTEKTFFLPAIPQGMYFVRFTGEEVMTIEKMIIN